MLLSSLQVKPRTRGFARLTLGAHSVALGAGSATDSRRDLESHRPTLRRGLEISLV